MKAVFTLALAYLKAYRVRSVLTSLAIAASVCLVVWVSSAYDTLLVTFDEYADQALGRFPLCVAPIGTNSALGVESDALSLLRDDPRVLSVEPMWARRVPARAADPARAAAADAARNARAREEGVAESEPDVSGRRPLKRPDPTDYAGGNLMLATDSTVAPFAPLSGRWLDPESGSEVVLSAAAAERLGVDVSDDLLVGGGSVQTSLHVVGVLDMPVVRGYQAQSAVAQYLVVGAGDLFVTNATAQRIVGGEPTPSIACVALHEGADINRFRFGLAHRLSRFTVPLQFQVARDIDGRLGETTAARNVRMQSYGATGIALLAALLVIFSTLNMGVTERARQLAMLRAVTLTRAQVAGLIALEALVLATLGFLVGLLAGLGILRATASSEAQLLHHGVVVGATSVALATVCAFGGSALACLVPIWRATRVRPLDAMAPRPRQVAQRRLRPVMLLVGLVLISINPLLAFSFPPTYEGGVFLHMTVGFVCMAAGFVLVAPGVVAFTDRVISPALARLFGIEPSLVKNQITAHLWRTVGAALSMAVGLGLYIGIQVWGFTMLGGFLPGAWTPDAQISFEPDGLPLEHASEVANLPGVDPERSLPVVVEQPRLLEDLTGSAERASVIRQDNVTLLGIDLRRALDPQHPLLEFEWVAGSREEVFDLLDEGRPCIVPDHFLRETGLNLGDTFEVVPPDDPTHPVSYTIAGAVQLFGWHWMTKDTGLRPRARKTSALIFADFDTVGRDFALSRASHVWLDYSVDEVDEDALVEAARALYARATSREVQQGPAPEGVPAVRLIPTELVREVTLTAAHRSIWIASQVPLVAFLVACFGLLNMILASIRSRRWDMGVMRAIGVTRFALVRVVVVEGLLIGVVACLLSLGFGVLGGWCGAGFGEYATSFGGMRSDLVIPWGAISLGLVGALLLSAAAALWPAIGIARAKPLSLLQQGRGAQ